MATNPEIEEFERGETNLRWFADNYGQLQASHPDQFVAIDRGALLEIGSTLDELLEKVNGKIDLQTAVIEFVPSRERIFVV